MSIYLFIYIFFINTPRIACFPSGVALCPTIVLRELFDFIISSRILDRGLLFLGGKKALKTNKNHIYFNK